MERAHAEANETSGTRNLKRYLDHNPECSAPKRSKGDRNTEAIATVLRTSDLSKCVFRCKEQAICGHCGGNFSAKHYMFECQDSPQLKRALEGNIPTETLMHGPAKEIERAALRNIFTDQTNIAKVVKHYPIKAECPEGHPVTKNYGWARYTNPYGRSTWEKENNKEGQTTDNNERKQTTKDKNRQHKTTTDHRTGPKY